MFLSAFLCAMKTVNAPRAIGSQKMKPRVMMPQTPMMADTEKANRATSPYVSPASTPNPGPSHGESSCLRQESIAVTPLPGNKGL